MADIVAPPGFRRRAPRCRRAGTGASLAYRTAPTGSARWPPPAGACRREGRASVPPDTCGSAEVHGRTHSFAQKILRRGLALHASADELKPVRDPLGTRYDRRAEAED